MSPRRGLVLGGFSLGVYLFRISNENRATCVNLFTPQESEVAPAERPADQAELAIEKLIISGVDDRNLGLGNDLDRRRVIHRDGPALFVSVPVQMLRL